MVRGEAATTRREMPRRKSFNLILTGLFHLRYFEDGLLEPGYKMFGLQKKNSNMVSTKARQTGFNIPRATIKFHLPT